MYQKQNQLKFLLHNFLLSSHPRARAHSPAEGC